MLPKRFAGFLDSALVTASATAGGTCGASARSGFGSCAVTMNGSAGAVESPSMVAQGLDPAEFGTSTPRFAMDRLSGNGAVGPRRYRDIWSAGHSVSGVRDVPAVADLVNRLAAEYAQARAATAE